MWLTPLVLMVAASAVLGASTADPASRIATDLQITELAMCPDGHTLAVRGDDKVALVEWPGGAMRSPSTRSELPPCAATALGFSSDGRWFARPRRDGSIVVLDAASGAPHATLSGHLGTVRAVAFSPDGKWLVSGGYDNDLRVWDMASGACVATLTSLTHPTYTIAWAPDGQTFYSAGASGTVIAWTAGRERRRESKWLGRPVSRVIVSADGRFLVASTVAAEGFDLPADIHVLDAATLAEQRVISSPDGRAVGLALAADGKHLLWAASGAKGIVVTPLEH